MPIFKHRFAVCVLLGALAACGAPSGEPEGASVDCAIGPGSEFANVCVVENTSADSFIIHHPDGGFRRFVLSEEEGATVTVADGAEPVVYEELNPETGMLEFGLAVDRYRLELDAIRAPADE